MIEIKEYNGFPNTVFIDGELLPYQVVENAKVNKKTVSVKVISDPRKLPAVDFDNTKYLVRRKVVVEGTPDEIEISILYLDKSKLKQ